jgi:hypothetical protein
MSRGTGYTERYTCAHIAESLALNTEVTLHCTGLYDRGERNDGDCGPAAVVGAIYYANSQDASSPLPTRDSYQIIREYAAQHLQQRTLMREAQVPQYAYGIKNQSYV